MHVPSAPESTARYRDFPFGVTRVVSRTDSKGVTYVEADQPLQPFAERVSDALVHWATRTPERTFLAQRPLDQDMALADADGWQRLSYAAALIAARSIGQALIERGLGPERPVVILSDNDFPHALLALGCLMAGVPYCPVSPAYSTVSTDFGKLRHIVNVLTPGLIFANDATRYGPAIAAIAATLTGGVEIVAARGNHAGLAVTQFDTLTRTFPTPHIDAARMATGPDSIAKFLFTSGSTKLPKAVINTHRMLCANQQQMRQSMPVLTQEPPVLIDWLPWNHTFGGNHNFGLVLNNGGTLHIDGGKPTPAGLAETLRNLREIAPTIYFNVPVGFEAIAEAMESDPLLRRTLLSRVRLFYYAGAGLSQAAWDTLHKLQEAEIGERIVMGTGLGMTESSPSALYFTSPDIQSGEVGIPTPGLEVKLVPDGDKTEIRYRGPNITPGYWRDAAATAEAFDDEGFFCTGDAVEWIESGNIHRGLRFDGRTAEDFKLSTGTFVSVGPLRARVIAAGAPLVRDVVITGLNARDVGALVFPAEGPCRALAGRSGVAGVAALAADAPMSEVITHPAVFAHMQAALDELAKTSTGSATRIARVCLLAEPPSIDIGEVTDKGSINQRAVLRNRDALVRALHEGTLPTMLRPTETAKSQVQPTPAGA